MPMPVRIFPIAILAVLHSFLVGTGEAQFQGTLPPARLGETAVQRWQFGFTFAAPAGPCRKITASQSVPMDWPEQTVRIVDQRVSLGVDVDYQVIEGAAKRMVVTIANLAAGETAEALVTFECRRGYLLEPDHVEQFSLPARTAALRRYLSPSPYVESSHRTIRALAAEIGKNGGTAWQRAEAIYDWVRENIRFVDNQGQEPVDTLTTLQRRDGDCDEMSCLFIALCRASGIPARIVQVPGHVYAEFYLDRAETAGCWIPCQLSGTRAFGHMPEHRPVLQKGDNLSSPHSGRRKYLILPQHVTAESGTPTVQIVVRRLDG
jgi:transglutaminase-like putative cysteine protease